jgi:ABC-type amino acid transport substrate-binding protein
VSKRALCPIGCLLFIVCHLSLVIGLAACTPTDAVWEHVLETGILHVGMDASFPPFESIAADGTLIGFDVDLARELSRRLGPAPSNAEGVEAQFVANLPYDGLYDALTVGRVDVVISALVVNPARMEDFAYSTSYFDAGQVLVVHGSPPSVPPENGGEEERSSIENMADLSGRTLAVEFGTQGDLEARKWARQLTDLTVIQYQTAVKALAAVAVGEVDAALVDRVSALATVEPGGKLVIMEKSIVAEPYAVGMRRDSTRLLHAINEALATMETDGTMEALIDKWLE